LVSLAFSEAEMIDPRREYLQLMRRMPCAEAERLHNEFGIPVRSIGAVCPVPTLIRFTDKARSRFEPREHGVPAWVLLVCVVDARFEEEIEAVDPLRCVSKGPVVDLVGFHPGCREQFALRTGNGVVLGAIAPQHLAPEPVPVWDDITDWLRAGCRGIVLLTNDRHQRVRILRRIESIEAQQPDRVKAWLAPPTPRVFAMRAAP
jgi:hypothetical protein